MDPVIPADILTSIYVAILTAVLWVTMAVLAAALTWLALHWAGRAVARKRARLVEPDNCGDQGGHPTAAEQQRRSRPKTYEEWVETGGQAEFQRASRSARANRPQDF